jgi:DNA replication and repair protein RecF
LLEVRARFLADMNRVSGAIYQGLTGSTQQLSVTYQRNWGEMLDDPTTRAGYTSLLNAALEQAFPEEIRRGSSLVGPHRDELRFAIDDRDVRQFGSQGEQRTAALALRVSEFTLLQRLLGEPPVLLLDDILSELDHTRRGALLDHLAPVAQVIVTTTDVDAIGLPAHAQVRQYQVVQGVVAPGERPDDSR